MTLVAIFPSLATYAIAFQTFVYMSLPRHHRFMWAPMVTGVVGALFTLFAGITFGFETIGLGTADPGVVAGWSLVTFSMVALIGTILLTNQRLRPVLADQRLGAMTKRDAFSQIMVRIPVMTAFIEEAFFRGVLHAALIALYSPAVALWVGAGLFGLWHIGPGLDQSQMAEQGKRVTTLNIAMTVVATTVAGAGLVWLRIETGSIWVPVAVHSVLNMTMALFARIAARRTHLRPA